MTQHATLLKPNAAWREYLWKAMTLTGKGFKKDSLKHTGKGKDRRNDKLEGKAATMPKMLRSHYTRYGETGK